MPQIFSDQLYRLSETFFIDWTDRTCVFVHLFNYLLAQIVWMGSHIGWLSCIVWRACTAPDRDNDWQKSNNRSFQVWMRIHGKDTGTCRIWSDDEWNEPSQYWYDDNRRWRKVKCVCVCYCCALRYYYFRSFDHLICRLFFPQNILSSLEGCLCWINWLLYTWMQHNCAVAHNTRVHRTQSNS